MVIALIVIACIILLFVLLFTVRAYITIDLHDEFALSVKVLGIPLHILPQKQKKYNPRHYTLKKIRKRDAKEAKRQARLAAKKAKKDAEKAKEKAALDKLTKAQRKALKKEKRASRPALTEFIPLVGRVAKLFFSRFFGKLHVQVAHIHIHVGSDDAATTAIMYGAMYQSLSFLMEGLQRITHMDGLDKADILLVPDFTNDRISFDANITFRVTLGHVVGAAIKAGFAFLFGYNKIKPDPDHPKTRILPPAPPKPPRFPRPPKPTCGNMKKDSKNTI